MKPIKTTVASETVEMALIDGKACIRIFHRNTTKQPIITDHVFFSSAIADENVARNIVGALFNSRYNSAERNRLVKMLMSICSA